jgi:CheY-like chemotaxis protein
MKTILHVEDDALIVHIYRAALVRAGYQVEVAEDGLTAAKMLSKSKPDLVLLDIMLPTLTGTDVIKYIRSTPTLKSTPVIILSDASKADLAREAIESGVERIFLKSQCTPILLIDAINELLGGTAPDRSAQLPSA